MKKERPILFSTPMVQAILAGRKTQTRRVVKDRNQIVLKCPYGTVGDVLWVRCTWLNINSIYEVPAYVFKADNPNWIMASGEHWKPSIHMPKKAARIWLEIVDVNVEELDKMTFADAEAEGVQRDPVTQTQFIDYLDPNKKHYSPKQSFKSLWDKINGVGAYDENPLVWVVEFKVIEKP